MTGRVRRARAALALLACAALVGCRGDANGEAIGGPPGSRLVRTIEPVMELAIDPHWQQAGLKQIWLVDEAARAKDDFHANLALEGEVVPRPTTLAAYVDASIAASARSVDQLRLVSREPLTLASGLPAERTAFTGGRDGSLGFVAITALRGQSAATVILTAPQTRLAAVTRAVEPYMRTLRIG